MPRPRSNTIRVQNSISATEIMGVPYGLNTAVDEKLLGDGYIPYARNVVFDDRNSVVARPGIRVVDRSIKSEADASTVIYVASSPNDDVPTKSLIGTVVWNSLFTASRLFVTSPPGKHPQVSDGSRISFGGIIKEYYSQTGLPSGIKLEYEYVVHDAIVYDNVLIFSIEDPLLGPDAKIPTTGCFSVTTDSVAIDHLAVYEPAGKSKSYVVLSNGGIIGADNEGNIQQQQYSSASSQFIPSYKYDQGNTCELISPVHINYVWFSGQDVYHAGMAWFHGKPESTTLPYLRYDFTNGGESAIASYAKVNYRGVGEYSVNGSLWYPLPPNGELNRQNLMGGIGSLYLRPAGILTGYTQALSISRNANSSYDYLTGIRLTDSGALSYVEVELYFNQESNSTFVVGLAKAHPTSSDWMDKLDTVTGIQHGFIGIGNNEPKSSQAKIKGYGKNAAISLDGIIHDPSKWWVSDVNRPNSGYAKVAFKALYTSDEYHAYNVYLNGTYVGSFKMRNDDGSAAKASSAPPPYQVLAVVSSELTTVKISRIRYNYGSHYMVSDGNYPASIKCRIFNRSVLYDDSSKSVSVVTDSAVGPTSYDLYIDGIEYGYTLPVFNLDGVYDPDSKHIATLSVDNGLLISTDKNELQYWDGSPYGVSPLVYSSWTLSGNTFTVGDTVNSAPRIFHNGDVVQFQDDLLYSGSVVVPRGTPCYIRDLSVDAQNRQTFKITTTPGGAEISVNQPASGQFLANDVSPGGFLSKMAGHIIVQAGEIEDKRYSYPVKTTMLRYSTVYDGKSAMANLWSDIDAGFIFPGGFGGGIKCTGLYPIDDSVIFFSDSSTFEYRYGGFSTDAGSTIITSRVISDTHGCVAPKSIAGVERGVMFLSSDGVRSYGPIQGLFENDGVGFAYMSRNISGLNCVNNSGLPYCDDGTLQVRHMNAYDRMRYGYSDAERNSSVGLYSHGLYYLFIPISLASYVNGVIVSTKAVDCYIADIRRRTDNGQPVWSFATITGIGHVTCALNTGDDLMSALIGTSSGLIVTLDNNYITDIGYPFEWEFTTRPISAGGYNFRKHFRRVKVGATVTQSVESASQEEVIDVVVEADDDSGGKSLHDEIVVGVDEAAVPKRILAPLDGRAIKVHLSGINKHNRPRISYIIVEHGRPRVR